MGRRKKLIEQQYLLNMSSQYGELPPTNGWDRLASLGHPSEFQRVSVLSFITALTSLSGGQPNFARWLAILWAATLDMYIFGGTSRLMEFCQVQHSYCIQVLHSPILAALLHGTPVVYVSQSLQRVTRKGIRELLLLVCTTYILRGGRHVRHQPTL